MFYMHVHIRCNLRETFDTQCNMTDADLYSWDSCRHKKQTKAKQLH